MKPSSLHALPTRSSPLPPNLRTRPVDLKTNFSEKKSAPQTPTNIHPRSNHIHITKEYRVTVYYLLQRYRFAHTHMCTLQQTRRIVLNEHLTAQGEHFLLLQFLLFFERVHLLLTDMCMQVSLVAVVREVWTFSRDTNYSVYCKMRLPLVLEITYQNGRERQ